MDSLKAWYNKNYIEITWFIIGFLTWAGFNDLAQGNYIGAVISFGLVALNYTFSQRR